jgi:hypothetical protein
VECNPLSWLVSGQRHIFGNPGAAIVELTRQFRIVGNDSSLPERGLVGLTRLMAENVP